MTASLYEMARQLARPVARRHLPLAQADASLVVAALHNPEPPYDPMGRAKVAQWVLRRHMHALGIERVLTGGKIKRATEEMLEHGCRSNQILAEIHNINAAQGLPLTEQEAQWFAEDAAYWAMRRNQRG